MINSADLAQMRAAQEATMSQTATIMRATIASDSYGGQTVTRASAGAVKCRVAPTGGREAQIAAKLTALVTWSVTIPYGADVQATDLLVLETGRTFQVEAVLGGGSVETARRAICTEVGANGY